MQMQVIKEIYIQALTIKNKEKGREHLARFLAHYITELVDGLNNNGHSLFLCDYSGDKDFENSEQTFSGGKQMGNGLEIKK